MGACVHGYSHQRERLFKGKRTLTRTAQTVPHFPVTVIVDSVPGGISLQPSLDNAVTGLSPLGTSSFASSFFLYFTLATYIPAPGIWFEWGSSCVLCSVLYEFSASSQAHTDYIFSFSAMLTIVRARTASSDLSKHPPPAYHFAMRVLPDRFWIRKKRIWRKGGKGRKRHDGQWCAGP